MSKPDTWAVVTKVVGFTSREDAIAYREKVKTQMYLEPVAADKDVTVLVKNRKEA